MWVESHRERMILDRYLERFSRNLPANLRQEEGPRVIYLAGEIIDETHPPLIEYGGERFRLHPLVGAD